MKREHLEEMGWMITNYIVMARLLLYAVKFQSPQIQFSETLSTELKITEFFYYSYFNVE